MSGGIAIMGWSAGCQMIFSIFGAAHNPMIANEEYALLQQYIGKFMLYDPPHVAFGYPVPFDNKNYVPWEDTSLKPEDIPVAFSEWVSSYYDHPCYDFATRSLPSSATIHDLNGIPKKTRRTSVYDWSEEDKAKGIEMEAMKSEVLTFMPPSQATLCKLSEKALFDTESVSSWFPNVDVTYIGVTSTNWMCAWGEIETKRLYEAALKKNGRVIGRKIHFLDMVGLNHFVSTPTSLPGELD
ncbi:hypothetical protein HHX47_DHR10000167 [Lentinula edodes]|nr:hypothetical protein HHX47_DHR10000167 [Lentinula edodes]